jgi:methionyl-tRNA formyltransferase
VIEGGARRWEGLASKVEPVGPLNGSQMVARLRELQPDYLLLAGSGILKAESLAAVGRRTLNAHPALLPWVPGVGVIEGSLKRGVPIGVTAHYVDGGVDTGPIIRRELLHVTSTDTLNSLRSKAEERCARLLAETAVDLKSGRCPPSFPQRQSGSLCRWPSLQELSILEEQVKEGLALRLYERWRSRYGSDLLPDSLEVSSSYLG